MHLSGPSEVTSCAWVRWLEPALGGVAGARAHSIVQRTPLASIRPDKQTCSAAGGWT
jgi:hypothetical protein